MTDVVIDNKKHYGPQNTSNGRIIAIAVSPTQWTIAVAYQDETLVMVPLPELHGLRDANESFDQLVAKMAQRLGMVGLMIDFAVAANVIPLAAMVADANSGGEPMLGRGTLQLIGTAA